jgi:phosphate uptake regulator
MSRRRPASLSSVTVRISLQISTEVMERVGLIAIEESRRRRRMVSPAEYLKWEIERRLAAWVLQN